MIKPDDIKKHTAEFFTSDPDFVLWCLDPERAQDGYWCGYTERHPQDLVEFERAVSLVRCVGKTHPALPSVEKQLLLDRILTAHPEVEYVQLQINYLDWDDPKVQSRACYEVCVKHHKPVIVMEPVKGGRLARLPEAAEACLRSYAPEASIASWGIRFAASLENVAVVLSGMTTPAQLADNLAITSPLHPLNEEELALVQKAAAMIRAAMPIGCTACRYCCDGCPMGIAIPDVFKALNTIRLYGEEDRAKNYYKKLLETSGKAEDCVQCGQCESVCPQHLPIIDLLKEASEKLDVPMTE